MKLLVTGCAGLLGSSLCHWALERYPGIHIAGVDDLSGGYIDNVPNCVSFYQSNLLENVDAIFEAEKPNVVYHFAAYAAEGLSPFMRCYNYKNNLIATSNILNACINHDIDRLVFTSSMAVYGDGETPFDENMPRRPIDPYGVAKAACEQDIEIAGKVNGLDWCIIRPHNVYGERQNIWDRYRNVLGIWIYQHMNGMPLTIFGDGEQKRAFSYMGDCLEPLWKASSDSRASKQIINLGGTREISINEASDLLIEVMGGGEKIYHEPRHEVKYAWSTTEKSIKLLDYEDKTTLCSGLSRFWEWAQCQPSRKRKEWESFEVTKGLYSFWR